MYIYTIPLILHNSMPLQYIGYIRYNIQAAGTIQCRSSIKYSCYENVYNVGTTNKHDKIRI